MRYNYNKYKKISRKGKLKVRVENIQNDNLSCLENCGKERQLGEKKELIVNYFYPQGSKSELVKNLIEKKQEIERAGWLVRINGITSENAKIKGNSLVVNYIKLMMKRWKVKNLKRIEDKDREVIEYEKSKKAVEISMNKLPSVLEEIGKREKIYILETRIA